MHNAVISIPQHGNGRLYKTSICRHYDLGNCSIGTKCQFAHGEKELRNPNDPLPTSIPTIEANLVITNYKTVLCKYDQQGFCKNGASCPYAHGASEKKQARIAPSCLKKCKENKENDDNEQVENFLQSITDKLINNEAFKLDKVQINFYYFYYQNRIYFYNLSKLNSQQKKNIIEMLQNSQHQFYHLHRDRRNNNKRMNKYLTVLFNELYYHEKNHFYQMLACHLLLFVNQKQNIRQSIVGNCNYFQFTLFSIFVNDKNS